ncbi:universal stress protein [Haloplanus halobius]|uniref:universal stress protein n=1 Tax=Haloplanus halobius TaxID=2934938 RepID=UPI00200D0FC6|nr:universal stress protein [Haloplanus sp. XH21]
MYDTIYLPNDGSDPAEAATTCGIELARRFDAAVSVVHVLEADVPPMIDVEPPEDPGREALDEEPRQALERAETQAADADVPCRTAVEPGRPHERIVERAAESDADLIVMGTHGRTGLERLLIGSVTERVLRTSDVPVLTTRADGTSAFDAVLVPTDGSDCAARATDHALAIADRYDATVHALSVVDVQSIAGAYHGGTVSAEFIDSLSRERQEAADAVAEQARERGVDVETTVLEGSPGRTITDYADEHGIDLVSMGTHGRSGVSRYLLGSVTERVLRTFPGPVLTAPPDTD